MTDNERELINAALHWKACLDAVSKNMQQRNLTMELLNQHDADKAKLNSAVMRLCNGIAHVDRDRQADIESGETLGTDPADYNEPCGFAPKLVIDNDK